MIKMKNRRKKGKEFLDYILSYEVVGEEIIITTYSGEKYSVPYSKEKEYHLKRLKKLQASSFGNFINRLYNNIDILPLSLSLTILTIVVGTFALFNGQMEIGIPVVSLGAGGTLGFTTTAIKSKKKLEETSAIRTKVEEQNRLDSENTEWSLDYEKELTSKTTPYLMEQFSKEETIPQSFTGPKVPFEEQKADKAMTMSPVNSNKKR